MRVRRTSVLLALPLMFVALAALAQPKGKKPDPDKAAPSAAPAPSAEAAPTVAPPPTADPALGAPPPRSSASAGPRPSPLTPRPEEFPEGGAQPVPKDYDDMLGSIAALRGRVAALTSTLFASKLRIVLIVDDDEARVDALRVTLDDGVVYAAPKNFSADDDKTVYEHAVAPGHHVLGVEIERFDPRGKDFRTSQISKVSVVIPEGKKLEARVRLEDDSDMAEDFPEDQEGHYDLRVRVRARVVGE